MCRMIKFTAKVRKRGNSLGLVVPKEIVEREGLEIGETIRFLILNVT